MPPTPTLRPATHADAPAVERLLVASSLPLDGVADMFATDPAQFVVAVNGQDGAEIEAVAALEMVGEFALLRSVAVRPDWRGTGLGQRIVQHAIDGAADQGVRALYLLTDGGRVVSALRLHGGGAKHGAGGRARHRGIQERVPGFGDGDGAEPGGALIDTDCQGRGGGNVPPACDEKLKVPAGLQSA